MGLFKKRAQEETSVEITEGLLKAFLSNDAMSREKAMNVPTFAGCINKICNTISTVPIYLYERKPDGSSVRDDKDRRPYLINIDTGDTLTGADFKKAIVRDYFLNKGAYIYIKKEGTKFRSLHYVDADEVTFLTNEDPIMKEYKISCGGHIYRPFEFVKVIRNTKKGYKGNSIIQENAEVLATAYNSLKFENKMAKRGGRKKGFLESEHRIDDGAIGYLKSAFDKMYSDDSENAVVLNNGVKFHEAATSATEMQLNENKKSNAIEICKLFSMPPSIINGGATNEDKLAYVQYCIIPILEAICKALDRDLLLEREKRSFYFAADTSELIKADIKTRYEAYSTGYKTGFLQIDDIRKAENMELLNLPYIKLGLQDVLYNPQTGVLFTPNMGKAFNINDIISGTNKPDPEAEGDAQVSSELEDLADKGKDNDSGKEDGNA